MQLQIANRIKQLLCGIIATAHVQDFAAKIFNIIVEELHELFKSTAAFADEIRFWSSLLLDTKDTGAFLRLRFPT
jgi:hypothetical protein